MKWIVRFEPPLHLTTDRSQFCSELNVLLGIHHIRTRAHNPRTFSRRTRHFCHGGQIFGLQTLSRLKSWSWMGWWFALFACPFCSFLGFFLVAAFIKQDYDCRSLLLLSGDIESNTGPSRTCGVCGIGIRAGASFLSCAGRCGGPSHKQFPCSGLRHS